MFLYNHFRLLTDYCLQHLVPAVSLLIVLLTIYVALSSPLCYPSHRIGDALKDPPSTSRFMWGLGHTLIFAFWPERFLRNLVDELRGAPGHLRLFGREIYLAIPGKQIEGLFRNSRGLVPTPSLFDALYMFFGLSGRDVDVFNHNRISKYEKTVDLHTDHPDVSRRIMEHQKKDFAVFLQGQNLTLVMKRFIDNIQSELSRDPQLGDNLVFIPDLFSFVANHIFRAHLEALYGEEILKVCPTFCQDFWTFYDGFPHISRGLPRWLAPSSHRARDKMHENFDNWRTWCEANFDWNDDDLHDTEYEPIWGTQYVRKMVQRYHDLGLSRSGVAAVMLGYLFVTMANTIPAALWMIFHIILDEELLDRVHREVLTDDPQIISQTQLSMKTLMADPLINSIYHETLRLRVASAIGRTATHERICLAGGWKVKKSIPIMCMGWLAGLDEYHWNTDQRVPGGQSNHSLESFWAERFLTYSSDPASGPVKKELRPRRAPLKRLTKQRDKDETRPKLTLAGLRGHYFPFGGGEFRCPGESMAKQIILVSAIVVLQNLQIKLEAPLEAIKTKSSHREFPFGSHTFDRQVPISVRRRAYSRDH